MAFSTSPDDLGRELWLAKDEIGRLKSVLYDISNKLGIQQGSIVDLNAGGVELSPSGINLPLRGIYDDASVVSWGDRFTTGSGEIANEINIRGNRWGTNNSNVAVDIFPGNRQESTRYPSATVDIYAYARASTGGSSGYNVFMEINATDADGELLWWITNGLRGNTFNPIISAVKNGAGSTGGISVGIGTLTPTTGAALDIVSTRGSLLIPRLTSAQKDSFTAVSGMIYYNSQSSHLETFNGGTWKIISSG